MTDQQNFRKLMQQGHGRCVSILRESTNVNIYRDDVITGCRKDFAYDAQCEGTRAWFVHRLTEFFDDKQDFISAAVTAFDEVKCNDIRDFEHLCDLLTLFSMDGSAEAAEALRKKYNKLKMLLIAKTAKSMPDYDRDCFAHLASKIVCTGGENAFADVVSDIGMIISANSLYDGMDFDYFRYEAEQFLGKDTVTRILGKNTDEMTCLYINSIAEAEAKYRAAAQAVRSQLPREKPARKEETYDIEALLETLYTTSAEYEDGYSSGHHGAAFDLLRAREQGIAVPDDALVRIYGTTLCSCCRYESVKLLSDAGKISEEMIKECLSDCYRYTRNLAEELTE